MDSLALLSHDLYLCQIPNTSPHVHVTIVNPTTITLVRDPYVLVMERGPPQERRPRQTQGIK
jgi:hypothetical protein